MCENAATAAKQTAAPESGSRNELKLKRGCDCGQHTPGGHECDDCRTKSSNLQRCAVDRPQPATALDASEHTAADDTHPGIDLSHVPARTAGGGLPHSARASSSTADDAAAVRARLGSGSPLDSGVRSRMESAFGRDFAQVRTHTDAIGHRLSSEQNARAFTVDGHIAFGAGEYRPGTLVGDALLAHELAHVIQQDGVSSSIAPARTGTGSDNALEQDADRSAVRAVTTLWGEERGTSPGVAERAEPRARSGLRLSRCGATRTAPRTPAGQRPAVPTPGQTPAAPGSAPTSPAPAPQLCVPSRPLTWADFQGTPTSVASAWTRSHHELATENGKQFVKAVFEPANSWVQPKFANPTDRSLTGCANNIAACERIFRRTPPGGGTPVVPLQSTPSATCPAAVVASPSVAATSAAECTSVLGPECDRVAAAESARLLRHEQLHFDIACVLAQKGTAAMAANPTMNPQNILNAVTTKSNQLTNDRGNQYDADTDHGCIPSTQASWESRVQAGLPTVTIP